MTLQPLPALEHRFHSYEKLLGSWVHDPLDVWSFAPRVAEPVSFGAVVFVGTWDTSRPDASFPARFETLCDVAGACVEPETLHTDTEP
jgi:hypothetical protein